MTRTTTQTVSIDRRSWGMVRRAESARELVEFLAAAFRCLAAFEAMERRSMYELEVAMRDRTLDFGSRRYLQRVLRLKRTGRMELEEFWPAFFA